MSRPAEGEWCAVPRCRNRMALIYLGKPVCDRCWDRFTSDKMPDDEIRRRLGLAVQTSAIGGAS